MERVPSEDTQVKRRKKVLIITLLCLIIGGYWYYSRNSMDRVASAATNAFNHGDVDALLALTSDDEIKQCNLTRENVRAMLNDTLWKKGVIRTLRHWHFDGPGFIDDEQFLIYPSPKKQNPIMVVWVLDNGKDHQWHLGLSYTLSSICILNAPDPAIEPYYYSQLAIKYGISGRWMNHTGFVPAAEEYARMPSTP